MNRMGVCWDEGLYWQVARAALLDEDEAIILKCMIQSKTNKEISKITKLSESTVRRRVADIYEKYDTLRERGYDFPPRKKR